MARVFNVIIERDSEGYYVASVPELRGCYTQAKTLDTLMKRIREAIELCLEVEGEEISPQQFILNWNSLFERTQPQLVAAARRARQEIVQGRAQPMDYERL
ncbi:MAG: type II toxin-antitoxin system HicB family antitoxin [Deltaproteobacteria bacterium]